MRKKKQIVAKNYLDKLPIHAPHIGWHQDEKGIVTLNIENKGIFNRAAQLLLKKPKVSYVHLDELGSFVWPLIDGKTSIYQMGEAVEECFREKAHPLYERLAKYFQILDSYGFIKWSEPEKNK